MKDPEFDPSSFDSTSADFDFLDGTFTVANRRAERLVGCEEWIEFPATLEGHRKILGGLANVDRFLADLDGEAFEGVSLRVFDPATRLWTIHWADTRAPRLKEQVVGGFRHGVGEFRGEEPWQGQTVQLRFLWTGIASGRARWEQAYYDLRREDWETNWTMDFTRTGPAC